ncbi:MAG TPA: Dps family protein [Burkholderiaceae bacterium]|nr:Dps family protein [Burkholderiaceae bacterium]
MQNAQPTQNAQSTQNVQPPRFDIGIDDAQREKVAQGLSRVLADSFRLYMKTHSYHWNVTGPMFQTLHVMFQEQYTEQWNALDVIAERIRALGVYAPGTSTQLAKLSTIPDDQTVPSAQEMIRNLVDAQQTVARTAREVFTWADEANDQPTADLLTQRMDTHEKNAWMLRSLLA